MTLSDHIIKLCNSFEMEIKKWTDESASGVGGCPYGNMNNAIVIPFYHLCKEK